MGTEYETEFHDKWEVNAASPDFVDIEHDNYEDPIAYVTLTENDLRAMLKVIEEKKNET